MAVTRLSKDKWASAWTEADIKKIDERARFMRATGAIDDYSAWAMAEQNYYQETVNCAGFRCR